MSYDEPNASRHWSALQDLVPWAQHVSGIKGFDAVHRACGELSSTPYLITVDADTTIYPEFLELTLNLPYQGKGNLCWSSLNQTNHLTYGNGGIKLWDKTFISSMRCHELGSGVDFCWDSEYLSLSEVYSDVHIGGSALQAYRAGFREGVKLSTLQGRRLKQDQWDLLGEWNVQALAIWCTVGMDVMNGDWAILGARHGLIENAQGKDALEAINDLEGFKARLSQIDDITLALKETEKTLSQYTPFSFPIFSKEQSEFVKRIYTRPKDVRKRTSSV